jgi:hypothetical protein
MRMSQPCSHRAALACSILLGALWAVSEGSALAQPASAGATRPVPAPSVVRLNQGNFPPPVVFDRDGTTLWLADLDKDRLRLTQRDRAGKRLRTVVVPDLRLYHLPNGIVTTEGGLVVYGNGVRRNPAASHAYLQFFDGQGRVGERLLLRGTITVLSVVPASDGSLALLLGVFDRAEIFGTIVVGPSSQGQQPHVLVVLRRRPDGTLDWLYRLPDEDSLSDSQLVGTPDGKLALLLATTGGGVEWLSSAGQRVGAASAVVWATGAAFDGQGRLWVVGATKTSPDGGYLAPAQILERGGTPTQSHGLCEGHCLRQPTLHRGAGDDVMIFGVTVHEFQVDGVTFAANRRWPERWSLLTIGEGRLRAHHQVTGTRSHWATASDGTVAIVMTGLRDPILVDGRRVAAAGQTVLIQIAP